MMILQPVLILSQRLILHKTILGLCWIPNFAVSSPGLLLFFTRLFGFFEFVRLPLRLPE